MAAQRILARRLLCTACRPAVQLAPPYMQSRHFQAMAARLTDGVFRGLSDTRLPIPWIEAFRLQQEGQSVGFAEAHHRDRNMTPRKMRDSYHRVVLPLGQDPWLSDTYINSSGHIRLGTLFMDLDALSGIIVYKHTGPGVTTVTAAVDRIVIAHPLTEIADLEYSGMVTYATGRSSVEITCNVARARGANEPSRPEDVLLTCTFTMVALDPVTHKPTNIPEVVPETPEEEALFRAGAAKMRSKKLERQTSLLAQEPDDAESALIHRIWLRQGGRDRDGDVRDGHQPLLVEGQKHSDSDPKPPVPMANTQLSTAAIMQPQYRNRHQTMIFGGYHVKQTFELAFCCAASFAHARPIFLSADPCTFRHPVPVGSVLYLTATVAYTDPPVLDANGRVPPQKDPANPLTRVHVRVDSKVRDVDHGQARPTGQFNYTFAVPKDVRVLPHTYDEYMMYIDARRRVLAADPAETVAAPTGVNLTE